MSYVQQRFINITIMIGLLFLPQAGYTQHLRPVSGGILLGISGMALIEHRDEGTSFLVVHDNKNEKEGRVAIITIAGQKQP